MICSSGRQAYDRILSYIEKAKAAGGEVLIGGSGKLVMHAYLAEEAKLIFQGDDTKGFFIQPTVILTKDPQSVTMTEEIFGPVITVIIRSQFNRARWKQTIAQVYVYDDANFEKTLELVDNTSAYALTGSM